MAGIGKFGALTSYQPGDAVWVKGCPRDGVAHIIRANDGGFHPIHKDLRCSKGTYEIEYNSGAGILMIELADLKPAKPAEDTKDQAKAAAARQQHADGVQRNALLMEKLLTCEPMTIDENDPMSFMGGMFGMLSKGFGAMANNDPDTADLEALRFQDAMAVSMGRSLGYCGAPRSDYADGERVRARQGINEAFWKAKAGDTGTVVTDPNSIMHIFPVDPSQPKGISVEWDDGTKGTLYVTNLEPA